MIDTAQFASAETVRMDFPEPLSSEDQFLIHLLAQRYEGKDGTPFLTFSRDGITTLVCPKAICGSIPELGWKDPNAEPIKEEAQRILRLSEREGAGNV